MDEIKEIFQATGITLTDISPVIWYRGGNIAVVDIQWDDGRGSIWLDPYTKKPANLTVERLKKMLEKCESDDYVYGWR